MLVFKLNPKLIKLDTGKENKLYKTKMFIENGFQGVFLSNHKQVFDIDPRLKLVNSPPQKSLLQAKCSNRIIRTQK